MQDDIPTLRRILARDRTIAVVGLSAEWHRPSHFAAKYLQEHGYRIVPVNPRYPEILGEKSYPRLEDIPFPVDMVDVFRKAEEIPAVARSAVAIGAKTLWQQLGLMSEEADRIATEGGLGADDRALLDSAFAEATPIPGDCGDEYRKPPFLTASGDLSHHLDAIPSVYKAVPVPGREDRFRVSSGSIWEPLAGYSRAVRVGDRILVSGTTATHGSNRCVAPGDPGAQATYILDKIAASISALGGKMEDVVRTRIYLKDASQWEPVSRAHGRFFSEVLPANTLIEAGALVGEYEVEIEAEAVL